MNGPEHYREAERLLSLVDAVAVVEVPHAISYDEADRIKAQFEEKVGLPPLVVTAGAQVDLSGVLGAAQVHATLALTAATVADRGTYAGPDGFRQDHYVVTAGWSEATL